jgi:hypothetical protein
MDRIAGQERAFSRALMLGDAVTLNRNVFGDNPRLRLTDWLEPEDKRYELLRDRCWRVPQNAVASRSSEPPKFGVGPPPAHLSDRTRLKHTERVVLSPIDVALWNCAKWRGIAFGEVEGAPPLLGIMFENGKLGQAIFETWRERWGDGR